MYMCSIRHIQQGKGLLINMLQVKQIFKIALPVKLWLPVFVVCMFWYTGKYVNIFCSQHHGIALAMW